MKKYLVGSLIIFASIAIVFVFWSPISTSLAQIGIPFIEKEPDIPAILKNAKNSVPKEEFLQARAEYFSMLRGVHKDKPVDPKLRQIEIEKIKQREIALANSPDSNEKNLLLTNWTPIGPAPIPNGNFPFSGRTISIAIHPTNPDIVYVGTAQGGLYRSTNGGTNWTPLMDSAQSLAIGAIAISPSDPETVYVGTGEHTFSGLSFFGVGVYRIENASTTANMIGPLNKDSIGNDIFTGRGISRIIVHPTDSNTIFVSSTSGLGGIGGVTSVFPARGIYRSSNATMANPTFTKIGIATNRSVRDIAIDPNDPNIMVANLVDGNGNGGIYRSTNALAATPNFTQTEVFNTSSGSTSDLTAEFAAIHPTGDTDATFYAAVGNGGGRVLKSIDSGQTWTQQIDNNFCTPQCFYDIAVAVDPTDANKVYLGGSPAVVFAFSNDSGTSFTESSTGLHVDSHAIEVSKSDPTTLYFGSDGGIYKSTDSGLNWTALNNTEFFATQFMGLAIHPTDPNFTIGGTQDNGTQMFDENRVWSRVDGGDGGYTVIDQNASNTTTDVRMYHTYFNRTGSVLGYATRPNTTSSWAFRGCLSGTSRNGINCNDSAVLFYAPLERGAGDPNTIYYGTDRLYRSADEGTTHTEVSQQIQQGVAISSIGISPQDDNIRIVGLRNGGLFGTTNGSTTLIDLDQNSSVPNGHIARSIIDPNDSNTAYVTLSNFNVNTVYKTTNLNAATPTWTDTSGTGNNALPQVPANAIVIDPQNSNTVYVGTDIGVFISTDAGTNWQTFGTGLPRTAVFNMDITKANPRKLRIATHGKGMYEIQVDNVQPPNKPIFDFDGDSKTDISVFRPNVGQWWYLRSSDLDNRALQFGSSTDVPTPADFTGDGKTDISFFRNGEWFVLRSEDDSFFSFPWGTNGDIPAPGDFDGDGKADPAVFRPNDTTWFILKSTGGVDIIPFGIAEDKPVIADYDGDGKDDIAIFRPSVSQWWINQSQNGVSALQFGQAGDRTVQGDYTGDGKADVAFFRPSNGEWFIIRSEDFSFFSFPWGTNGDIPAPGDYDGDGVIDATVFRPSNTTWFSNTTSNGVQIVGFGLNGDVPVPSVYSVP